MTRYRLRDDQWERIKDLLPGKLGDAGATARDNRRFVGAVQVPCGNTMARPAGALRRLEKYAPAVQPLGQSRRMGARLSAPGRRRQ